MTPKEKAKEIYFAMLNEGKGLISEYLAKRCSYVAVNEILNELVPSDFKDKDTYMKQRAYWRNVRDELNKL